MSKFIINYSKYLKMNLSIKQTDYLKALLYIFTLLTLLCVLFKTSEKIYDISYESGKNISKMLK